MNTRLIIENREIELDETVQFAITSQFEELSNPTTIINDWSKTVSIPFTARNNEIFGHIYNPDKLTVEGSANQALTGIYFNPYKKLDMRLQWGDDVLMVGYAKMNEVKQNDGKGTYEITLFGELGKVFQEMQKITFDTTTDNTDYLIDGSEYVDEYINKDLVYRTWTTTGQTSLQLYPKTFKPCPTCSPMPHPAYRVTDIIGFAPNNSFADGFNWKTAQTSSNACKQFTEILGDAFTQATGVEPDTVIPNGLLPREFGEYRSYLQLPYIYWNKLFQVFQKKAEEITGYKFKLDGTWFNSCNPYWYNLVYMLKPFDSKLEETVTNYYKIALQIPPGWGGEISAYTQPKTTNVVFEEKDEVKPIVNGNNIQLSDDYSVLFNTTYTIQLDISNYNNLRINPNNGLEYSFRILNADNNAVLGEYKYLMVDNDYSGNVDGYIQVLRFGRQDSSAFKAYPKLNIMLNKGEYGENVKLDFKAVWLNSNAPFYDSNNNPFMPTPSSYMGYINLYVYNVPINNPISCNVTTNRKRSYNHFTLNDLWNKDYNLFDEVIKYCKMYRIGVSVDEFNKKVIFKPYTKYFTSYTVSDWDNKVDKSKDFVITPITFDSKYILFNYKDSISNLGKMYKEKYGVNYGDYRLITDYNFNNKTTELFEKVTPSITNTDNVLSWTNLRTNHKIIYSFPAEIFVYNKDADNKQVDIFGAYYFHNGLATFSTEEALQLRDVYISDDTQFQYANNEYFYARLNSNTTQVTTFPKLDIVNGDNLCVFNIPKENYTYLNNYTGKASIYSNFWEKYLDERYNVQNKKITCYVMLKPHEYNQFEWNKLVKVGNQLCIVNKIYDYNITSNQPTKVDLVTIQDINGYTDDTFIESIDRLDLHVYGTSYFGGGIMDNPSVLGTFDAVTDVTFANDSKTYTTNNVKFTIVGDTIYYQTMAEYLDKDDIEFTVTLHNENYTASFNCVRYSTYPYPWIIIEDSNGNEVSTIYPGSRVYKFKWHGTETEGLDNKPTITIENHGTGSATIGNDWVENQVVIQEGDDDYFRNEYEVTLNTNMSNYSGTYLRFIVTDKEGWHETRDYPIFHYDNNKLN